MLPRPLVVHHLLHFSVLSRRGLGIHIEELETRLVFANVYLDNSVGLSIACLSCVTIEIETKELNAS